MLDVLPEQIANEIRGHLRDGCSHAQEGWEAGREEEDALTGDLGSSLRRNWTTERRIGDTGRWRWRMTYKKFRGRGPYAAEKLIGADGIVQIEVEDLESHTVETKGILFQAKKRGAGSVRDLPEQARKMESLTPAGAAVFEYGPDGYWAADAADVIRANGKFATLGKNHLSRLGVFLADRFLPCKSGKRGLYYEATRSTLFVPDETKGFIRLRTQLGHRFRLEVQKRSI